MTTSAAPPPDAPASWYPPNLRSGAAWVAVLAPGIAVALAALPKLEGFHAAAVGVSTFVLIYVAVSNAFTADQQQMSRATGNGLALTSLSIGAVAGLTAREVGGAPRLGLIFNAAVMAILAIALLGGAGSDGGHPDAAAAQERPPA